MARSCSEDGSSFMSRSSSSEDELKPMPVETYSQASPYGPYTRRSPRRKYMILIISIVSFIICMTFASIYGLDYEALKKEEIIPEPQFADIRNVSTYTEDKSCGKRDEAANITIWNDIVNKTSDLIEDMFTIAIQTYKRPVQLNKTIEHLTENKVPSLYEIVIVWNEVDVEPPADYMSEHGVLVRYRKSKQNSLNQKFLPDPLYRTQGILLSDDDWNYNTTGDLEYVFQQWRHAGMHRLVGAFGRCWTNNEVTDTPMYNFNCKGEDGYSMILTGLAFTHISYLEYYHSQDKIMTSVRKLVDESFNCEDIALNFVASMLTCEGPLLVLGKNKLDHQAAKVGISSKPGHIARRSQCLRKFKNMFGYMPLHEVQGYLKRGVYAQQ
ncbi:exostoses 3 [Fusarium longipes]|uniref:Exostoses 3 n=1 Tax=Fusarium longipes TaxID=694270 RepID=A0A395T9T6_9HYPO|nr:exostoses 3 [Fusarium longipes]